MSSYWYYLLGSASLSLVLNWLLIVYSRRRLIFIQKIRPRDIHKTPSTRIGGLAIMLTFYAVVLAALIFQKDKLVFSDVKIWGVDKNLLGLLIALGVLAVVNIRDDLKGVGWQIKLTAQIAAALVIAYFGIKIQWLSNPFGGTITLGAFDVLFVVIWLVVISNAINWLDGVNGLCSGVSAIALLILFFLSISELVNQSSNALLSVIALGSLIGFMPFNLWKGQSFLGDTGSMFLGFLIGVIAIISGGKVATAFLVLAIPFLDALVVIVSRLVRGRSPFQADQLHLHHRLLAIGFKPYQVVLIFWLISLIFGLIALNTQSIGKFWAVLGALVLMGALILIYSVGGRVNNGRAKASN